MEILGKLSLLQFLNYVPYTISLYQHSWPAYFLKTISQKNDHKVPKEAKTCFTKV